MNVMIQGMNQHTIERKRVRKLT